MFRESAEGVTFEVRVTPRAKRDEVVGLEKGVVKIRLSAPPVEGKANEALLKFLAERMGVAQRMVEIVRGQTVRNKVVRVRGMDAANVLARLGVRSGTIDERRTMKDGEGGGPRTAP